MEYIFGTIDRRGIVTDILKTVGSEHTDLTGKHEIVRKYNDCTITDVFTVAAKYLSKSDDEGKCYDWYEIRDHYRYMDYFSPQKEELTNSISDAQNAIIESDADRLVSEADIENALIEIDSAIDEMVAYLENKIQNLS